MKWDYAPIGKLGFPLPFQIHEWLGSLTWPYVLALITGPVCFFKNIINLVQLWKASKILVGVDIAERAAAREERLQQWKSSSLRFQWLFIDESIIYTQYVLRNNNTYQQLFSAFDVLDVILEYACALESFSTDMFWDMHKERFIPLRRDIHQEPAQSPLLPLTLLRRLFRLHRLLPPRSIHFLQMNKKRQNP